MNFYLEMPQKVGKKVGIHFYKNVLSEILNLPLSSYLSSFSKIMSFMHGLKGKIRICLHWQVGRNVRKVHWVVWQVPAPNIVRRAQWNRQCQQRECWLARVCVCRFCEIVRTPVTWCPVSFQALHAGARK